MSIEIKKRIITSFFLLFGVFLMIFSNFFCLFALLVISMFGFIEFSFLMSKIVLKNRLLKLLFNLSFIFYISFYSLIFFIISLLGPAKILIYLCLLICIASDIGGLIFGKLIKGPKLTRLSPQKTVAGSLGSFLLSIVTALTFKLFFPFSISSLSLILLGSVVSFGCQVGDIFFSFLKRKAKVKETGKFLPGHGGILDRIDSILVGLPFGIIISFYLN